MAMMAPCSRKVYFDIEINGEDKGRILMQLRSDVVPKTAENFRQVRVGVCFSCLASTALTG